ncbi:hypothetical protein GCM10009117_11570 [Gangjinia marincola]|uniref:Spheroidene monooxygenase n=1 Tax=Gangjinia marincola TaxID=578463 RepID=A0ABP3XUF5_9FLAO
MSQITTLTFFSYDSFAAKAWAFGMMQFAHKPLSKVDGLQFYKLLGSGREKFNPLPDWSTYALLQVWDDETSADTFFKQHSLVSRFRKKTNEQFTLFMKSIKAHGEWSGKNPFQKSKDLDDNNTALAVITRATIKPSYLIKFWKYVPISQRPIENSDGLLYTKGIGEVPVIQMATFSIWKDKVSLMNFAYNSKEHKEAIAKTRALNWYSEELFSRFQPYKSIGQWQGRTWFDDGVNP